MVTIKKTEEIIISYYPTMVSIANKRLKNLNDAKDLVQQVMFQLFKNLNNGQLQFRTENAIKPYCVISLKNTFKNHLKYKSIHTELHLEDAELFDPPSKLSADSLANVSDIYKQIEKVKDKLRFPFLLFYEGYSYEEISKMIQVPVGTVKNRIFRCRAELINNLD